MARLTFVALFVLGLLATRAPQPRPRHRFQLSHRQRFPLSYQRLPNATWDARNSRRMTAGRRRELGRLADRRQRLIVFTQ